MAQISHHVVAMLPSSDDVNNGHFRKTNTNLVNTLLSCNELHGNKPYLLSLRDHFFDTHERKRVLGKKRVGTISTGRNDIEKGSLGVRWEKARLNQAKMLPTKRMGISD